MRGWPVARALVVLLLLLLAGVPLYSLTRPRPEAIASAVAERPVTEKITVNVTFSQPPESFSVLSLGKEILAAKKSTAFEFTTSLETLFPPEGIDLVLEAHWPVSSQGVGAMVHVVRENGLEEIHSVRGTKEIFEVLTFGAKKG